MSTTTKKKALAATKKAAAAKKTGKELRFLLDSDSDDEAENTAAAATKTKAVAKKQAPAAKKAVAKPKPGKKIVLLDSDEENVAPIAAKPKRVGLSKIDLTKHKGKAAAAREMGHPTHAEKHEKVIADDAALKATAAAAAAAAEAAAAEIPSVTGPPSRPHRARRGGQK